MKKVLGNDNALFFSSFWKHLPANTLLLHNFTYFYVAKEDPKVCKLVNTPTGPSTSHNFGFFSFTVSTPFPLPVENQANDNAKCNHYFLQAVLKIQSFAPSGQAYHISLTQENAPMCISIESVLPRRGRHAKNRTQSSSSVISNYGEV